MKSGVVTVLSFAFCCIFVSSASRLEPDEQTAAAAVVEAVRSENTGLLAKLVEDPLHRDYPLPAIETIRE